MRPSRTGAAARFVRRTDGRDLLAQAPRSRTSDKGIEFLARHGDLFGLRDAAAELRESRRERDAIGWEHVSWTQVHAGIEVFGAVLRAHLAPDGELRALNGATVAVPAGLSSVPVVPEARAEAIALVAARGGDRALSRGLVVYSSGLLRGEPDDPRLAFAIEVETDPSTVRDLVLVDAIDGRVLDVIRLSPDALSRRLSQSTSGNLVWSEGNPDPIPAGWAGGSAAQVTAWQDEIDGARETYNLLGSVSLGAHLSFDGADAIMRTVHDASGLGCPNASWNGSTTNYCPGVTSDDVVGHEWGHAYTQFTSGLIYAWQPGALNESYSDVWGEIVDLLNARQTDAPGGARSSDGAACSQYGSFDGSLPATDDSHRWLMGEDSTGFGSAIRDMWYPECRFDPGRVSSSRYHCNSGDSGGVHVNSGVPNHLFALLVDGGTYNGQGIAPLGLTKAANLLWRATSVYETPVTDFVDHADALEQSCADLMGAPLGEPVTTAPATWTTSAEVISAADCTALADALDATELRDAPPCPTDPILDPDPPALCTGLGTVETVALADFEVALAPWTASNRNIANLATYDGGTWTRTTTLPDGRPGASAFTADPILGDCAADDESGVSVLESPPFVVPGGRPVLRVAFDHWIATEPDYDGGNVKVSVNGGPYTVVSAARFGFNAYNDTLTTSGNTCPLAGEPAWSGTNASSIDGSWGQSQLDLAGIAEPGDTVRLRFELGMDGCNGNRGWYVDDVHVHTCSDETSLPGTCPAEPTPGCTAAPLGRSTLLLLDDANDARDQLKWTWSRGNATALAALGDPRLGTSYTLCVWDDRGGSATLVGEASVGAGAGWAAAGTTGFRFSDRTAAQDGVSVIRVRSGSDGKASATVKAKGANLSLPLPATPFARFEASPAVTVQLRTTAGGCLESRFSATDLAPNLVPLVRGKHVGP